MAIDKKLVTGTSSMDGFSRRRLARPEEPFAISDSGDLAKTEP